MPSRHQTAKSIQTPSSASHLWTDLQQIQCSALKKNKIPQKKSFTPVAPRNSLSGNTASPLCPDLSGDHGLLGSHRGHEVLLGQEVQRKLHQEASDFAKFLLSAGQVCLGQTRFGLVLLQLGHVPHQGRGKAPEDLKRDIETALQVTSGNSIKDIT